MTEDLCQSPEFPLDPGPRPALRRAPQTGPAESAPGAPDRPPRRRPDRPPPGARRYGRAGVVVLAAAVLFVCYWRQSLTQPISSDGASIALQAWDMLHGNLLLHGWALRRLLLLHRAGAVRADRGGRGLTPEWSTSAAR